MKEKLGYMGIDQYGQTYHINSNHPRKWLLDHLCRGRASKMYVDKTDGSTSHVGYIIAGLWIRLYEVYPFYRKA